jgi:hypothetical protein
MEGCTMPNATPIVRIYPRDTRLVCDLKRLADHEGRSLSSMGERLLKRAIQSRLAALETSDGLEVA